MKKIGEALWNEPVLFALVINAAVSAGAAEGLFSAWISVVTLAVTAPILRRFTSPADKQA